MEFQNTVPLDDRSTRPSGAPPAGQSAPAPASEQTLAVRFTGSGSEYFRIWIVNLLLTLVTLGLYYPFAKARRLRYFHANTLVDEHALGFHGDPWKMLRGFLLMLGFGACYGVAGQFSATAGVLAAVLFAALWPALWQASLRFRLANTSWRGLRLRFTGDLAGAYQALLPVLVPAAVFTALAALQQRGDALARPDMAAELVRGLALLLLLGLLPMGLAWSKRYQHGHYQFAGETTRLEVGTGAFYGVGLRTVLMSLLPLGLLLAVVGSMVFSARSGPPSPAVMFGLLVAAALLYLLFFLLTQPYLTSRLQNLVWSGTRSVRLRFESRLSFRALAWLTLKNLLLMTLTLGLYRPFAVVNTARLRLQALQVHASGDIAQWTSAAAAQAGDASGDAAGDLLGIDIGL
ncbi:MAG: DUF898 family protein [Burkholderiales bacterium]|nr:DUF898 family protein [Burkholderiales bacterium]